MSCEYVLSEYGCFKFMRVCVTILFHASMFCSICEYDFFFRTCEYDLLICEYVSTFHASIINLMPCEYDIVIAMRVSDFLCMRVCFCLITCVYEFSCVLRLV